MDFNYEPLARFKGEFGAVAMDNHNEATWWRSGDCKGVGKERGDRFEIF